MAGQDRAYGGGEGGVFHAASRVLESASDLEKLDLAALEPTFHAFERDESLRDDAERGKHEE
jgi:Asp-tRNA(Asn)/Glu-tRNA(Gln) amidotransferase C subunit